MEVGFLIGPRGSVTMTANGKPVRLPKAPKKADHLRLVVDNVTRESKGAA